LHYSSVTAGPSEQYTYSTSFAFLRCNNNNGVGCSASRGYNVTWISERFMPGQINTKSWPERISLRLHVTGDTSTEIHLYRVACGKTRFQSVKKVRPVYFLRPRKFTARFSQRACQKYFNDVDVVRVYHLLQTVIALFVFYINVVCVPLSFFIIMYIGL